MCRSSSSYPKNQKFAIELRNKEWLDGDLAYVLRQFGMALVLQDRSWMADPLAFKFDPITADFTYIRWLGNRREIEAMVQTWDKVVIDRDQELTSWVDFVFTAIEQGKAVYAYANNHYQGHGPATIRKFVELWRGTGLPNIEKKPTVRKTAVAVQHRLFE